MLRINKRTDYAVRVMVALARREDGARLSTVEIQKEMLVPRPFLQRIVADLARSRLIVTQPGPNGGLQLARGKNEINLRQIYEAIEGPLLISECLTARGTCALDCACPVHSRWGKLQAMIVTELESITLYDLYKSSRTYKPAEDPLELIRKI